MIFSGCIRLGWQLWVFRIWNTSFKVLLTFKVSIEKSVVILIDLHLYVSWPFFITVFNELSFSVYFVIWHGELLFESYLFGVHCISCVWMDICVSAGKPEMGMMYGQGPTHSLSDWTTTWPQTLLEAMINMSILTPFFWKSYGISGVGLGLLRSTGETGWEAIFYALSSEEFHVEKCDALGIKSHFTLSRGRCEVNDPSQWLHAQLCDGNHI